MNYYFEIERHWRLNLPSILKGEGVSQEGNEIVELSSNMLRSMFQGDECRRTVSS